MKRFGNILFALQLSLIIMVMSVGTTVVHCLKNDRVQIVTDKKHDSTTSCCTTDDHHNSNTVDANCMKYQQVKLSPYNVIQHVETDFAPTLITIPQMPWIAQAAPVAWHLLNNKCKLWKYFPNSPPRKYLAFISVLLI